MLSSEKASLTRIGKDVVFKGIIKKLTLDEALSDDEKRYILSCAILFLEQYENDKRLVSYADFAYYIILKYSLNTGDLRPLYDFSVNFGFFPITNTILKMDWFNKTINDILIEDKISNFTNEEGKYIETLEQFNESKDFLNDESNEKCYIAPTSFGKSSIIVDYLRRVEQDNSKKIVIIVPTKSLLMQTYKNIKAANLKKKILIHNDMYNNENAFIAIFTQERALRMLEKKNIYFDILIIDEAHNLLDGDPRNILLSRLIKKNSILNSNQKIIYLSPLLQNENSLKINENQIISSHNIKFNIKEPNFYEYNIGTKNILKYNRFVNVFYKIWKVESKEKYIYALAWHKNFLYETRPVNIENMANKLCLGLEKIETTSKILELQEILKKQVHEDFSIIKTLEYGVIYLHGKLPDLIKEYLESKFKNIPELKYLVANTVILEWINLPIDTLFICNHHGLNEKDLLNLIGRVNRLSEIFIENWANLWKLMPNIHFLNDKKEQDNKLQKLRSRLFKDKILNPLLNEYNVDFAAKDRSWEDVTKYKEKIRSIQNSEAFLNNDAQEEKDKVKKYFIQTGINNYYKDIELASQDFLDSKKSINPKEWDNLSMMGKIYKIFFVHDGNITDYEFLRLKAVEARNYYENHILVSLKQSLHDNILSQYEYFVNKKSKDTNSLLYIGGSYWEMPYSSDVYINWKNKVYVDLKAKSHEELINLAIVKLKIEEDFIGFTLAKFIEALFDFELITEDEYNLYIYGTKNRAKIALTKIGLSMNLITRLEIDNQLNNLQIDEYNNLTANNDFRIFLNRIDDFYRFEIERYLV